MTLVWAGRSAPPGPRRRIVGVDGARTLGAKILVAGGGRCNVTHDVVDERAYSGSTRPAIRNVLRRFDVPLTVEFFRELGVELKREETGKLFPTTDSARDVLDALLRAVREAGAEVVHPARVEGVEREPGGGGESGGESGGGGFVVRFAPGADGVRRDPLRARRVVLATGGRSLPKTGSDGLGLEIARSLGHTVTEHVFPALAPLTVERGWFLCDLSGVTLPATLEVRSGTGKRLTAFTDSTLLTHFGLSGPSALDLSRHVTAARLEDAGAHVVMNLLPGTTTEEADAALQALGKVSAGRWLAERMPERLARALCEHAGVEPSTPGHALTRDRRRSLATAATALRVPVTGDRGYLFAEATAGGVPLREIRLETMESRVCPGLHLVGEMCDVDGRIGGYNFQWAWASGHVAGVSAWS